MITRPGADHHDRNVLLPKLLSGQVRVGNVEPLDREGV